MNLLIPGRHHILTNYQFNYFNEIIKVSKIDGVVLTDVDGETFELKQNESIDTIIFAVTSANHSNTRRNPLPFHLRAMMLNDFGKELGVPTYIYGIDDVKPSENFADYCIKQINNQAEGWLFIDPKNTLVACSTPVLLMYEKLGYKILPIELAQRKGSTVRDWTYKTSLAWSQIEDIAKYDQYWMISKSYLQSVHPVSQKMFETYNLGKKIQSLFADDILGDDGDLTETRDYNEYVRQMDENVEIKVKETLPFVRPGRIGDIGCAVGSWIKMVSKEQVESDFYGIEVSRKLFDICNQRKSNGDFNTDYVFFNKKNAVLGTVFPKNSMNTIHTSSLTHEIYSYIGKSEVEKCMKKRVGTGLHDAYRIVGQAHLLNFAKNRYEELVTGGVWINRDVLGPNDKDKKVWLKLSREDGEDIPICRDVELKNFKNDRDKFKKTLDRMSTHRRFLQFAEDFRKNEGYSIEFETSEDQKLIQCTLKDAYEFLSKKDYTDNWMSEMHEEFGFYDFGEWKMLLESVGFEVHPASYFYTNSWIRTTRWKDVTIYDEDFKILNYPPTTMILIGEKK